MADAERNADESEAAGLELLRTGSSFARYEIVRCIGVGGMGAVFEATHTLLRKRVALKTMHTNLGRSEASRVRFLREAETVARIRHPNVVDISDLGIENGVPFLVMDYLEGEDLARLLERKGQLSAQAAVDIAIPVAAGLSAVHHLGIIHRDIKPENIFLARDPHGVVTPKLIDFGVSKDLEASVRGGAAFPHTVTGTPHYMSPEQARGSASLDGRSDQYALGILLYQCLTGRLPYESTSLLELLHLLDTGEFTPIRALCADVPVVLEQVIHRAMSRHVRDRFPSMEAFGQALLPFAGERMRITYEHELIERPMSTQESLLALDLSQRQSAATTPAGAFDGALLRPQTVSGVRVREGSLSNADAGAQAGVAANDEGRAHGERTSSRRSMIAWMAAGALMAALLLALIVRTVGTQTKTHAPTLPAAHSTFHLSMGASPQDAQFELDGVMVGRGQVDRTIMRDGREHVLRISSPGHQAQTLTIRDDAPGQAFVALEKLPAPTPNTQIVTPAADMNVQHPRRLPKSKAPQAPANPEPDDPGLDIQLSR